MNTKEYILAVKWMFGMNNNEANKYIKEAKENGGMILETILEGYKRNAQRAFWSD